ncbi:MAG: 5-amino-6-(D-ribitylamino)uracil--L-tyrosine 4-hydroxyphenyl transferase CofH [Sterolibacterium sp.]|nr:5-amino-6-(D-ribitylamino)uracil--L-tyrosine 4-hydroxyphenyl transferase CofH [Sterolibacterium sp.]
MSCWAIVTVKALAQCKQRLAPVLDPAERQELVRLMLTDVIKALRSARSITQIAVISPEPLKLDNDIVWLQDHGSDLNAAATQATDWLQEHGVDAMLLLHADLPLLGAEEIDAMVAAGRRQGLALAPDCRQQGTNAIFLTLPASYEFSFGEQSLQKHQAQATIHSLLPALVDLPGLRFDVDTAADLELLANTACYNFIRQKLEGTRMPTTLAQLIATARTGRLSQQEALDLAEFDDLDALLTTAEALTLDGHGRSVGYSRKVFIPLTRLCRNKCGYCTFAEAPGERVRAYMTADEVMAIARAGAAAGCKEALFTLGDKPELRYPEARQELQELGHATTIEYLAAMARLVHAETGLLPHLNPGVMSKEDMQRLRPVAVSMGLMLEATAVRLCQRGGPHHASPDKVPAARLAMLSAAGELAIPCTSGILIGIGETRRERVEALLALRELQDKFGHLQEIIIQNFRAKSDTAMASAAEPELREHLWTIAVARLIFGPVMTLQAPPNLRSGELGELLRAGINDWGGVSPLTPDHVNPEAPWPQIEALAEETAAHDRHLVERLAIAPAYACRPQAWLDAAMITPVLRASDALGRARSDAWHPGSGVAPSGNADEWLQPFRQRAAAFELRRLLQRASAGERLAEPEIVKLFSAEGADFHALLASADELRADSVGAAVTYVVNCNINYTNICLHSCGFCAFAKGPGAKALRGPAYLMSPEDVATRAVEAWQLGAREVCLQGGIHPNYTGQSYLDILTAVKTAIPDMHVHAFSPLEVWTGAKTLGLPLADFLTELRDAGLGSLPGTAAEILDDEVRAIVCADKLSTRQWLEVMATAHGVGLKTTATIMFGHVDHPGHWARHLLHIRDLQEESGGFTEFVPLPFVHMESPLWRKGLARSGPTLREVLAMHAVARLVLHPLIRNIQTSWPKLGPAGALLCLQAGANDIGGTLMHESISSAAGGVNGQEITPARFNELAASIGRPARQRTTLYQHVTPQQDGDIQQSVAT